MPTFRLAVLVALAATLFLGCEKPATKEAAKAASDAQAAKNRVHFQYPDAEIHSTIDGGRSIMYVTRNYSRENGSDHLDFGCGTGKESMGQFKGRYSYQFVGRSHEGDVYVFTIEPSTGERLVIPYIYTGHAATIYDAHGMKITFTAAPAA